MEKAGEGLLAAAAAEVIVPVMVAVGVGGDIGGGTLTRGESGVCGGEKMIPAASPQAEQSWGLGVSTVLFGALTGGLWHRTTETQAAVSAAAVAAD